MREIFPKNEEGEREKNWQDIFKRAASRIYPEQDFPKNLKDNPQEKLLREIKKLESQVSETIKEAIKSMKKVPRDINIEKIKLKWLKIISELGLLRSDNPNFTVFAGQDVDKMAHGLTLMYLLYLKEVKYYFENYGQEQRLIFGEHYYQEEIVEAAKKIADQEDKETCVLVVIDLHPQMLGNLRKKCVKKLVLRN